MYCERETIPTTLIPLQDPFSLIYGYNLQLQWILQPHDTLIQQCSTQYMETWYCLVVQMQIAHTTTSPLTLLVCTLFSILVQQQLHYIINIENDIFVTITCITSIVLQPLLIILLVHYSSYFSIIQVLLI